MIYLILIITICVVGLCVFAIISGDDDYYGRT